LEDYDDARAYLDLFLKRLGANVVLAKNAFALSQGFTILHWTMIIKASVSQEGVVSTTTWEALPEPFKFDEPDDSDHYSVGFFAQVPSPFPQRIQPTFASSVAWPHVLIQYRSIEPFDWSGSEANQPVIIPDFTVSLQLW
jgi:hypothetical protein